RPPQQSIRTSQRRRDRHAGASSPREIVTQTDLHAGGSPRGTVLAPTSGRAEAGSLPAAFRIAALLRAEHLVGVVDPDAVGATVLTRDVGRSLVRLLPRPIALPFELDLLPSDRNDAGLHEPPDRFVVRLLARATRRVGHGIDLVTLTQRVERRHVDADLRP